jgi:3-oxoacyl-(acyl-carrier-protein) synthase
MPDIVISASAVSVPEGSADPLAPSDDLWEMLLRGKPQLRRRPHLAVESPACTLSADFAAPRATALAFHALRQVLPHVSSGRVALLLATTKGDLEPWLSGGSRDGLSALEDGLADMGFALPALRRLISNACASGAQAVIEGCEMLIDGDADAALVVGADAVTPFVAQGFHSLAADSPTGAKPFDASRDGLTLGEAGAAAVLRRDSPGARIVSWGCSNDANHISGPSRDGSGLSLAIERALVDVDRSRIVAICGHGTGTQYNDAMEARAFHRAFEGNPPPVFGIKGVIGHTLGAAGLIEVIVSAKVAQEGVIPPTTGYQRGDSDFALDVVHGRPREIAPGLVLTTNSGFGGMNTAIVVGSG